MTNQKYISTPPRVWQSLWEVSFPLGTAYFELVSDVMKSKYLESRRKGGPYAQAEATRKKLLEKSKEKEQENPLEKWPMAKDVSIWSALGDGLKLLSESMLESKAVEFVNYEELRDELRNSLTRRLNAGKLIAIGFAKDRRPQDLASIVPSDLIAKGYYNWDKATLHTDTLKMIDIRIGTTEMFQDCLDEDSREQQSIAISIEGHQANEAEIAAPSYAPQRDTYKPSVRSQGRPSKKEVIINAFNWAYEYDLIDFNNSNAETYATLRKIIRIEWPDEYQNGKGLQDGAMQKYLAETISSNRLE